MRIQLIAITAALTVSLASPAMAAEKKARNESIGAGSGAIIGAVAGGPVGLIVGMAVGAKLGETVDRKNQSIAGLQDDVDASAARVARLEQESDTLGGEIERLRNLSRPELVDLMQAGIEMDLLFRTDEDVLADTTGLRLAQLAGTLAGMQDIHIQLDGFADERGAAEYNQALSERRVQFIRDQFIAAGVDPKRINTSAHGESMAQDTNVDSFALERRVSVKLFIDASPSVAANPN